MSTINKKSRKPYRVLTDVKNKIWDEIHFLTDARSVDAADGADLETKVGAIKGITSSSSVTEAGYAVDAAALNSRLGNQEFGFDSDGKFAHREAGADTWVPFNNCSGIPIKYYVCPPNNGFTITYDPEKKKLDKDIPIIGGFLELCVPPKRIIASVGSYFYKATNVTFLASSDGTTWEKLIVKSFPEDQNSHEYSEEFHTEEKGYRFFKGTGDGLNRSVRLKEAYF